MAVAEHPEFEHLERELKHLIVDALSLEDVTPDSIDSEAALFGDGLGLDSIDALELSMVIHRQYGVEIAADDENNQRIFGSVRALAHHIRLNAPAGR